MVVEEEDEDDEDWGGDRGERRRVSESIEL